MASKDVNQWEHPATQSKVEKPNFNSCRGLGKGGSAGKSVESSEVYPVDPLPQRSSGAGPNSCTQENHTERCDVNDTPKAKVTHSWRVVG